MEFEFDKETAIKAALLTLTVSIFLIIYNLPKKALSNLRTNSRISIQSNRHFLNGAHLLSRSRSTRNKSTSSALAKDALSEADKALLLKPRDAAAHILRGLVLDQLGHRAAALKALDAALAPPAVKSLSAREKGDALVKRAEIMIGVNKRRRIDSALEDLVEAVGLTKDNCKAFCLLGQCYEYKGMVDDAVAAYKQALVLDSACVLARDGLGRFKSS